MTSKTDKLRAVFLTALMIGSVFAAGVAFTGSVAAASSNLDIGAGDGNAYTVQSDTTLSNVQVDDSDAGNSSMYVFIDENDNGEFDTGEANATNTSNYSPNDADIDIGDLDTSGLDEGTYDVHAVESASLNDGDDSFDTNVELTIDDTGATLRKATHYVNSSNDQPTLEVAFDENISTFTLLEIGLEDGTWLDDTEYTHQGTTNGRINITTTSVINNIQNVSFEAQDVAGNWNNMTGEDAASVTYAPTTLNASSADPSVDAATEGFTGANIAIEGNISESNTFDIVGPDTDLTRGAGPNSQIYVLDTDDFETGTYNVTLQTNGNGVRSYLDLSDLGLEVSASSGSFTTSEAVTAVASSSTLDRDVEAVLLNEDGDETSYTATATIDSDGQAVLNFGQVAEDDVGDYSVQVTDIDTGVSAESGTFSVAEAAEESTSFVGSTTVTRGDVATFNVSMESTDTATVQIGTGDKGYQANVTVVDDDGDGYATFDVNTYTMGGAQSANYQPGDAFTAGDDTEFSGAITETTDLPRVIADDSYQTTVRYGSDVSVPAQSVTQFYVEDGPNINSQTIKTAPGTYTLSNVATEAPLTEDSSITWKDSSGDYVVHEFDAAGIYGLIANESGSTFSQQTQNALNSSNMGLQLTQTEATTNANSDPMVVDTSDLLADNDATIVGDAENDTFWVIYDVGALDGHVGTDSVEYTDGFNATFSLNTTSKLVKNDNVTISSEYTVAEPDTELSYDGDNYLVTNASGQTIEGTTNLADGTNVTIRASSADVAGDGFIKSVQEVTVEDGEFSGELDFSDTVVNDTFTLSVDDSNGNNQVEGVTGMVVESVDDGDDGTTTTEEPDDTTTTEEPDDTTTEEPDDTTTEEPDDTTTTEAPDDTTTEAPGGDDGDDGGDDGGESGGSIPGFGVGVALVALLGAALLALRE